MNDDGVVNVQDLAAVEQQWLGIVPSTMFGDITGDRTVGESDYLAVRKRSGQRSRRRQLREPSSHGHTQRDFLFDLSFPFSTRTDL